MFRLWECCLLNHLNKYRENYSFFTIHACAKPVQVQVYVVNTSVIVFGDSTSVYKLYTMQFDKL